jgi:hypothetical protein
LHRSVDQLHFAQQAALGMLLMPRVENPDQKKRDDGQAISAINNRSMRTRRSKSFDLKHFKLDRS